MSTNYYLKADTCSHCGHSDEDTHIGKSSCGWRFLLKTSDKIKDLEDLIPIAMSEGIVDEWGTDVTIGLFLNIIYNSADLKVHEFESYQHHTFYDSCDREFC